MKSPPRVDPADFDRHYRRSPDPWEFRTSPYEQRRYGITVAALGRPRYRRCFEPACSVGELTGRLAERCDSVVAIDPAVDALASAAEWLGDAPNVDLRRGAVPEDWPEGTFDLVVLSEIGYYFERDGVRDLAQRARRSVEGEAVGEILAVHWRERSADHLLSGDAVHAELRAVLGPTRAEYVEHSFRLDSWVVTSTGAFA